MDPYTHVLFADYVSTDVFCHFSLDASLKPYMFSGSIFPDIGYFGKNKSFSDVIHNNLPHKFVEKLCSQLRVPEEIAFFWGFVSHVVLDQVGHPLWTHRLISVRNGLIKDDILHRGIEWGLGRYILKLLKDFHLLNFSCPDEIFLKVQDLFFKTYGMKAQNLREDFEKTVITLKKTIPLVFKIHPFIAFFSQVLRYFKDYDFICRAYPVLFPEKLCMKEKYSAFSIFKISKDKFVSVVKNGLENLDKVTMEGFKIKGEALASP